MNTMESVRYFAEQKFNSMTPEQRIKLWEESSADIVAPTIIAQIHREMYEVLDAMVMERSCAT